MTGVYQHSFTYSRSTFPESILGASPSRRPDDSAIALRLSIRPVTRCHTSVSIFDSTNQTRYHLPMNLNLSLIPHLDEFVHQTVTSARHQSASEVVRLALCLLEKHDRNRQAKLDWLRQQIQKGLNSGPASITNIISESPTPPGARLHCPRLCNATDASGGRRSACRNPCSRQGSHPLATAGRSRLAIRHFLKEHRDISRREDHTYLQDCNCLLGYRHLPYALHRQNGTVPAGRPHSRLAVPLDGRLPKQPAGM